MGAQTIRQPWRRRASFSLFAMMAITPLLACSEDGDPITDADEFARFDAIAEIQNLRTVFWNGTQFQRGGSAHITIQGVGEDPPCCLVIEGNDRLKQIRVIPGETWFIRAYALTPGVTPDFTHWEQNRCRVTATGPTGFQPKPVLTVHYDNAGTNHLVCSGGWENF
jgi:hypothetical protein